jgi:Fe-S-cluster-containing dehydrogenase component
MKTNGLLIQYEYCTGCHTCEVACKQEHNYPVGKWGIKLNEIITEGQKRIRIDYIPFPTEFCDLCSARTSRGDLPACVKHCQSQCMSYRSLSDLVKLAENRPRSVIFTPRASANIPASI